MEGKPKIFGGGWRQNQPSRGRGAGPAAPEQERRSGSEVEPVAASSRGAGQPYVRAVRGRTGRVGRNPDAATTGTFRNRARWTGGAFSDEWGPPRRR